MTTFWIVIASLVGLLAVVCMLAHWALREPRNKRGRTR